jgi:molybdopterin synthase sulfur carrier subunit
MEGGAGMKVTLKLFADLRKEGDDGIIPLQLSDDSAIKDLLDRLKEDAFLAGKLFDEGTLKDIFIVLVNGRRMDNLNGLDTALSEGDEVSMFPPVAGG